MILSIACATFMLAACGGSSNQNNASNNNAEESTSTEAPSNEAAGNDAATSESTNDNQEATTIDLTGNDQMKYNKTEFTVKAGQEITIHMKNIGKLPAKAMSHDVVVLKPGSDVKAFGMAATKAGELEKVSDDLKGEIIAKTKLLGPGESDEITVTFDEPGKYPFLCSFPGHYATMNGTITVE